MDVALMDQLIREHTYSGLFFAGDDERGSDSESEREEEEDSGDDDDDANGSEGEEEEEEEEASSSEPSSPAGPDAKRSSGGGGGRDGEEEEEEEEEEKGDSAAGHSSSSSSSRCLRHGKGKKRGEGAAAAGSGAVGGGKAKKAKKKNKKNKTKEKAKVAIDVIVERECSYNPVPWSKRQRRTSANTVDILRARQQGFNARRPVSAPLGGGFIPNTFCRPLGRSQQKMFCGRFSTSGDVLLTASQDSVINLYDSESVYRWSARPADPEVDYRDEFPGFTYHMFRSSRRRVWNGAPKPLKTIRCLDTAWSVISTDFSPDEKWLAYSSWSPYVHLCNTRGDYELHQALDFKPKPGDSFCLFAIQFSPSNTHILGGGSDNHVYLYSLERKERVARIRAHDDDVNAVAFADSGSQVVLSGGDDCVIKIWDLRSPDAAVGGLCGHQAGVTCITAKGDGRHFISNSKDQTMKLWDMRRMLNPKDDKMKKAATIPHWDYRHMPMSFPALRPKKSKRASDESVKTFHGHKVLQTLIRCYFSPAHTTGQRFVMSGSADGRVCIWDILTGNMVENLSWHNGNTRDVSWHPHLPLVASFSWDAAVGLWGYSGGARDQK